ncbi:MAG: sugar transferase [Pseudomonadota bacterium]
MYDRGLKRAFDLCLVLFTAPVWLSVILFGALLTALDGHSPFYCQSRVGRDGKRFRIWKLRTMVVDADAKLKSYLAANPQACAEWNAHQKLKNDPRVTPVGRILRKTSLDELPQLFNVLFGDMSLVGPRPMMVCQEELYKGESYYDLRPGLTGLWQVSERNESCFVERVDFDDTYAANASLGLDLRVLAKTVGVVLRGTGY